MQNLGFAFSLIPLIRRWGRERGEIAERLEHHLKRFHTHPCLAPSILGSVIRIEETGGDNAGREAAALKDSLMGPYAALGDPLFSGALRPLASVSGVLLCALGVQAAPWVLLGVYNVPAGWIRWRGFREGYRLGRRAFEFFQGLDLPRWTTAIRWAGVVALALLGAVLAAGSLPREGMLAGPGGIISALAALMAVFWFIIRGVPRVLIPYGLFALFLIVQVLS
jgi:PTS system mannose-specific IID component